MQETKVQCTKGEDEMKSRSEALIEFHTNLYHESQKVLGKNQ